MDEQSELIVRRARGGDLDAVASLWHESASSMDGTALDVPPADRLRRRIDAELSSGWELHVALRGGRIVGMLALRPGASTLDQIFVAPAEQGKGVGRALLDVAKGTMSRGFTLRMDAENERARRFYEAQGMAKVSEGTHPRTGILVHFYGWKAG